MKKPAARVDDKHICPMYTGNTPHKGGPILPIGSPNVKIGGKPAARKGDRAQCNGPIDEIASGSSSVFINGKKAARKGDRTSHGGTISSGASNVNIG